jgi:FtsZ-binding cell division protein ZapB
LENLETYVSRQKSTLTDLNRNVVDLKNQKAELEKIVQSGSETVEAILGGFERKQQANRWKDILISFFVGVFSSITAALLYEYNRRRQAIPDFNALKNSIKSS